MSRYIDLTEFAERIKKHIKPDNLEEKAVIEWCKDECIRQGYAMPTADVVELRHGEWSINSDGYYPYCSICKTEPKNGVMSKYCPECGAKMDGERSNNDTRTSKGTS